MTLDRIKACVDALSQTTSMCIEITGQTQAVSASNTKLLLKLEGVHQFSVHWVDSIADVELCDELADTNGIVCTTHLNASQANSLRARHIQYIDQDGNAYIKQNGLLVFVRGMSRAKATLAKNQDKRKRTGKAFQPSGLKVVYALLMNPQLASASMRVIAEQAGVALGSVSAVINDLVAHGYLHEVDKSLINKEQLINRWAELYPYSLRDKAFIGRFTAFSRDWWQQLNTDGEYQVSGEVAALKMTGYLNPKDGIVYVSRDHLSDVLNAGRLRKLKDNEQAEFVIDVYEPFWKPMHPNNLAPELVVYSDLLSTNDPRNEDAARRLLNDDIR